LLPKETKQVDSSVLTLWNEIGELNSAISVDLQKFANGNSSAGVRARKGLRNLKTMVSALTKLTIETDKARKSEKAERATEE